MKNSFKIVNGLFPLSNGDLLFSCDALSIYKVWMTRMTRLVKGILPRLGSTIDRITIITISLEPDLTYNLFLPEIFHLFNPNQNGF